MIVPKALFVLFYGLKGKYSKTREKDPVRDFWCIKDKKHPQELKPGACAA